MELQEARNATMDSLLGSVFLASGTTSLLWDDQHNIVNGLLLSLTLFGSRGIERFGCVAEPLRTMTNRACRAPGSGKTHPSRDI
jgi:hypothetical protein